jgi:AcrR family transcriptional regulator
LEDLQKILDTAEGMFRKYGIRSVTMSDLARQLGMSKKTLYVHLENKRDLISKIMASHIDREQQMILKCKAESENALDEMMRISLQVQETIKSINPSILFDLRKYHYPIWEQFEVFRKDFIYNIMRENMERGKEEGIYRADLNSDVISRIYISTVELFADDELFPADSFPRSDLHLQMVMYHLHGIISENGQALLSEFFKNINDHINL